MLNSGQNLRFSLQLDLEIWKMTLKNNRAPLPCYFKLCASFQSHRWIQTGVAVRKRSIRVKIADYLFRVTLKFDRRPWKTIGLHFFTTSNFVHHFKAISQLKLELQSGNVKFGSNRWFIVPCDLGIWWITLENNRAPLLWECMLCASYRSHWWIQTGVTVRKHPNWAKSTIFLSRVTLKFDGWPRKTIGHLS